MIEQKLIDRINEFVKISKQRELTNQEKEERELLRKEYIKQFKEGFKQTLKNVKVVDENGQEINRKGDC